MRGVPTDWCAAPYGQAPWKQTAYRSGAAAVSLQLMRHHVPPEARPTLTLRVWLAQKIGHLSPSSTAVMFPAPSSLTEGLRCLAGGSQAMQLGPCAASLLRCDGAGTQREASSASAGGARRRPQFHVGRNASVEESHFPATAVSAARRGNLT